MEPGVLKGKGPLYFTVIKYRDLSGKKIKQRADADRGDITAEVI